MARRVARLEWAWEDLFLFRTSCSRKQQSMGITRVWSGDYALFCLAIPPLNPPQWEGSFAPSPFGRGQG